MKFIFAWLSISLSLSVFSQSYAPAAGQEGSTAISYDSDLFHYWATEVQIQRGLINLSNPDQQDHDNNHASFGSDTDALGIANNLCVSLGDAGTAILKFEKPIQNGNGFDFAVFENGFGDNYLELALVEVSSDDINYFRFPSHSETQTDVQIDGFGELDPRYLNNLAGKYRVYFGTPFDLDDLPDDDLLDKNHITSVKLIDVVGSIDENYATYDAFGNKINDPFPTPFWSGGFDLDAIGIINYAELSTSDESKPSVKIYPNPATGYFFIGNKESAEIKIYDTSGNEKIDLLIEQNQKVDVSTLPPGVYFVRIKIGKKTSLHRLLVR